MMFVCWVPAYSTQTCTQPLCQKIEYRPGIYFLSWPMLNKTLHSNEPWPYNIVLSWGRAPSCVLFFFSPAPNWLSEKTHYTFVNIFENIIELRCNISETKQIILFQYFHCICTNVTPLASRGPVHYSHFHQANNCVCEKFHLFLK